MEDFIHLVKAPAERAAVPQVSPFLVQVRPAAQVWAVAPLR
jgi:hypothetical protein